MAKTTHPMEFWFEFASPYSHLSALRVEAAAGSRGVTVQWRPFLLGPIFRAQGWANSPFNLYPAKGRYMWRDVERRARRFGLPFAAATEEFKQTFPQHSVRAARIALVGLERGWGVEFVCKAFTLQFVNHADIANVEVLTEIVREFCSDPEEAMAASTMPQIKEKLRRNVDEASQLGIFGAPTFAVGSELFWGDDRMDEALDWATQGAFSPTSASS